MPAKTLDFNKIMELSENLYEAALILGKRARQINEELYQKKRDRLILEELEGGFEEGFLQSEQLEVNEEESPDNESNPIINAQEEFFNQQLEFHYEPVRK